MLHIHEFVQDSNLRGNSAQTATSYRSALLQLERFLDSRRQDLTPMSMLSWGEYLLKHGYAPDTQELYRRVTLQYLTWAEENYNSLDYPSCIKAMKKMHPKRRVRTRYALSEQQIENLLKRPRVRTFKGLRDRLMLQLLYATLRANEVLALTKDDIDIERNIIIVRNGKGGKMRRIPIPLRTRNLLEEYLSYPIIEKLFPFKYSTLQRKVKRYMMDAEFPPEASAHWLRHSGATHLYQHDCEIKKLSKILGHSNLAITERYLSIAIEDLEEGMSHHPLNQA
jgi:site-specific recombinase XerD